MILRKSLFSRAKFDSIPQAERAFFVQAGVIFTELMILNNTLHAASIQEADSEPLRKARTAQCLFFARILTGKLAECWEFFQQKFYGPQLSRKYVPMLTPGGREALDRITNYFGRRNLIHAIRNNHAFHYSQAAERIDQDLHLLPETAVLEWYIPADGEAANFLFDFSCLLSTVALLNEIDKSDHQKAMGRWLSEVFDVAVWFRDACDEIMFSIAKNYFGTSLDVEAVEIPDPPKLGDVKLPYFVGLA